MRKRLLLFPGTLRGCRHRQGLTQEAAADKISDHLPPNEDITAKTYQRWERAEAYPHPKHYQALQEIDPHALKHLLYLLELQEPSIVQYIVEEIEHRGQTSKGRVYTATPEEREIGEKVSEYIKNHGQKIESPGITSYVIGFPDYHSYIEQSFHSSSCTNPSDRDIV